MPPVEAWEKVWIDGELYSVDVHAYINCTACHGGQSVEDMDAAHEGMVASPAEDPITGCASCHPDNAPHAANSLHKTLEGYDTVLQERSVPENHAALEEMQTYHCNSCHATCGDCHVSQPKSVGGGLLEGHVFVETPPMSRTCTGCHGSRVKNEYYGLNEGYPGDVHLREARMACTDCHTGLEMHGQAEPVIPNTDLLVSLDETQPTPEAVKISGALDVNHRYDGPRQPTCESCHLDQIGVGSGIPEHEVHPTDLMACEVCHSVSYTHCTNCHVDRQDGVPFYSIEAHSVGFYIGQNPLRSAERPYKYVTVRHVPIDPDSFSAYGDDLLINFLNRPTWTYATPHNTQLNTPQTTTCKSCHENNDVFLTADKVAPGELGGANLGVIVEQAPLFPEGYEEYLDHSNMEEENIPAEDSAGEESGSDDSDFWGDDSAPAEEESSDSDFWGDDSAPATEEESSDADFWGDDSSPG